MLDDDVEPDIEWLIQYTPPIAREQLDSIQDILRQIRPFVPGVYFDDPYDVASYLPRQMIGKEEFCLLVDRNVVTRWTSMVRGNEVSDQHRVAAAIMLFAQAADLLIEPSLAFHEIVGVATNEEINVEVDQFYTAEETAPDSWAAVALGTSDKLALPAEDQRRPRQSYDFSIPLYRWRRNYVLALKIAELQLKGGTPEELVMRLFDWMYHDYLIGSVGVQLASHYFAPGAPKKRLLKWINEPDREKALRGIRNAAWDLTLVSDWLRRLEPSITDPTIKQRWILCSLDDSVKRMAENLVSFDDSDDDYILLKKGFEKIWKPEVAARIVDKLRDYIRNRSSPTRYLNQDPQAKAIEEFIAAGEECVRNWSPARSA